MGNGTWATEAGKWLRLILVLKTVGGSRQLMPWLRVSLTAGFSIASLNYTKCFFPKRQTRCWPRHFSLCSNFFFLGGGRAGKKYKNSHRHAEYFLGFSNELLPQESGAEFPHLIIPFSSLDLTKKGKGDGEKALVLRKSGFLALAPMLVNLGRSFFLQASVYPSVK